jgi:HlyD family secretion protein
MNIKELWAKTEGWKLPIIGAIALIFTFISVFGRHEAPIQPPVEMPTVTPYETMVAGIGVVEPRSDFIAIGTELGGVVRKVHVEVGQMVKKGTPLFSLDQRDIEATIASLRADLKSAMIQDANAALQFKLVDQVKDKRAVARDLYNQRKYAVLLAKSRVNEIKAQIEQAKTTKKRLTVAAPISGEILLVDIRPGEFATTANEARPDPLIIMGDTSILNVRVEFDEENSTRLSEDAPAKAYKRGNAYKAYPLTFVRYEPHVIPKQNVPITGHRVDTRVLQVIYSLPKGTRLFTGQQMDVYVEGEAIKEK